MIYFIKCLTEISPSFTKVVNSRRFVIVARDLHNPCRDADKIDDAWNDRVSAV